MTQSLTGAGVDHKVETLGSYGATLTLIEVGLGSLLHSLHVPFAGVFLSLNQGYLLCRASIVTHDPWIGYSISNIAAVLKSLSPAGNKLGPMLSLSMQGLLFNIGTGLLGVNRIGLIVGMILLSIWSFVQPLVTYYLFFGEKLFTAVDFWFKKIMPFDGMERSILFAILGTVVLLKMLIAVYLAILAWKLKGQDTVQDKLAVMAKPKPQMTGNPIILALKDLCRPIFLLSLVMTAVFLIFSQHQVADVIGYMMRPLAIGFIFFYFSRTLTLDRWLLRLHGGKYETFAKGCETALKKIRKVI